MSDTKRRLRDMSAEQIAALAKRLKAGSGAPTPEPCRPSRLQRRLLLAQQVAGDAGGLNSTMALNLEGALDVERLRRALEIVISRHAILRTTFREDGTYGPLLPLASAYMFKVDDISGLDEAAQSMAVDDRVQRLAAQAFDLLHGPLIRVVVVRLGPALHCLGFAIHHVAFDAWSRSILLDELAEAYDDTESVAARPPSPDHAAYVAARERPRSEHKLARSREYWSRQLTELSASPLDAIARHVARRTSASQTVSAALPGDCWANIQSVARSRRTTPFAIALAAYVHVLHRISAQQDIAIITSMAVRDEPITARMVGPLIETLLLRMNTAGASTAGDLMDVASHTFRDAIAHCQVPFDDLVELSGRAAEQNVHPLSRVALVLDPSPEPSWSVQGIKARTRPVTAGTSPFDLMLLLTQAAGSPIASLEFRTDLIGGDAAVAILKAFIQVVSTMVKEPERALTAIALLSPDEIAERVTAGRAGPSPLPDLPADIGHVFVEVAARLPDAVALRVGARDITYAQLLERANRLALHLHSLGCGPGNLVVVALARDVDFFSSMLAATLSGATFLLIDIAQPSSRVSSQVAEASPSVVLTRECIADTLGLPAWILLVDVDAIPMYEPTASTLELMHEPGDGRAAYRIYTSGSTGKPKAIDVSHRSVVELARWQRAYFGLSAGNVVSQWSTPSFDGIIGECCMSLLCGATLAVVEDGERTPEAFERFIVEHMVDVAVVVPSFLARMSPEAVPTATNRWLVVVGETFSPLLAARWLPLRRVINAYGPAEFTVYATAYEVMPWDVEARENLLPIGQVRHHARAYVLDHCGSPMPYGLPGELHLAGDGVAIGYACAPTATAMRFLPDPFVHVTAPPVELRFADAIRAIDVLGGQHEEYLRESMVGIGARWSEADVERNCEGLDPISVSRTCELWRRIDSVEGRHGFARYLVEGQRGLVRAGGLDAQVIEHLLGGTVAGKRGADLGSGGGEVLDALREAGADAVGVDISPWLVERARQRGHRVAQAPADGPLQSLAEAMDVRTGSLDFVLSTLLLDRVASPRQLLANMLSLLRPQGRFALQVLLPHLPFDAEDHTSCYTEPSRRIAEGGDVDSQRDAIVAYLGSLGAVDLATFRLPYAIATSEGVERMMLWSVAGAKGKGDASVGQRMYRTGDRALLGRDGNLTFLGRVDREIKIRGARLDPAEVERVLEAHPAVARAFVCLREIEAGTSALVAWCLRRNGMAEDAVADDILAWANGRLASWAMPRTIRMLDHLPIGPSGKPDESLLQLSGPVRRAPVEPRDAVEANLLECCRSVLGPSMAGIDDSVFDAGADSISLLRISARLQGRGLSLDIRDYFECRTVRRLALRVAEFQSVAPTGGAAALSPIQSWVVRVGGSPRSWQTQWCVLAMEEDPGRLALASALEKLVQIHDALRTEIRADGIFVHAASEVSVQVSVAATREAALVHATAALDLQNARMLAAAIVPGSPVEVVVVISHFATDAMSWRIIIEDLGAALAGRQLRSPATAHLNAVRAMVSAAGDGERTAETAFWLTQIEGYDPAPEGPVASIAEGSLDTRATRSWLDAAQRLDTPPNALMHAALARLLTAASGEGRAWIDVESNGRSWPGIDLSRTVGWFTALYPVVVNIDAAASRVEHARASAEVFASIPSGGVSFQLLAAAHPDRLARERLAAWRAPVVLNYLGKMAADAGAPTEMALLAFGGATPPADVNVPYPVTVDAWIDERATLSLRIQCTVHSPLGSASTLLAALVDEIERIADETSAALPFRVPAVAANGVPLSSIVAAADPAVEVAMLNPMQAGMVFHCIAAPNIGVYENQMRFRLEGMFDAPRWREAWCEAVQAEPALRTAFVNLNGTWLRFVRHTAVADFDVHDLRDASPSPEAAAVHIAQAERQSSFALDQPPLARMCVLRLGDARWLVVWTFHHLVMDGWSVAALLQRLLARYAQDLPIRGSSDFLADVPPNRANKQAERFFWSTYLHAAACLDPLRLGPVGNPGGLSLNQHDVIDTLDAETTLRIIDMANRAGVTLACYLQAAWACVLAQRSGSTEVMFGLTVSGRDGMPHIDDAIGLFVTTVPVRVAVSASMSPSTLLQSLQQAAHARRRFETAPLADIHRWAGVISPGSLFNHVLLIENFPMQHAISAVPPGLALTGLECHQRSHYPATLVVVPGENLTLELSSEEGRLTREEVVSILGDLRSALENIGRLDVATLGDMFSAAVAVDSRGAHAAVLRAAAHADTTIQAAFARTVKRIPDAAALIDGGRSLSYAELDAWANRLAHALLANGVRVEDRVGLFAGRSFEAVVGILAIVKAGGAWVPLDPTYPAQRLSRMVNQSRPAAFLVERSLPEEVAEQAGSVAVLDIASFMDGEPAPPPLVSVAPDNIAYILFTSGSTGAPKGVEGTHRSTLAVAAWREACFPYESGECCIHKTPLGFGDSIQEIVGPLLAGVPLAFLSVEGSQDPHRFVAELFGYRVSRLIIVPSLLSAILASSADVEQLVDTILWIASGEALPASTARLFRERLPHARLVNLYGVSEAACDATWTDVTSGDTTPGIGRPVAGASIHLFDEAMRPVAMGALGEIHIGGEVVNRGYLGDARQTASAFVPDPSTRGGRLFRTRDLGLFDPDGGLTYHGRADQQINLRGMRIESAEVEAALMTCPGVADAAVVFDIASQSLTGWVVPDEREALVRAGGFRVTSNGLAVFDYNRGETDYVLQEIDEGHTPVPAIANGATVIDVGANIGLYSLASHYAANDVRIVALEPAPLLIPLLRRNLVLHGCTFELWPCAVGSRAGTVAFTFYPRASLESGCHTDVSKDARIFRQSIDGDTMKAGDVERLLADRFVGERIEVEMVALGDVVDRLDAARIALVKLDVERAELDVLRGLAPRHFERIDRFIVEVEEQGGTREAIEALFPPTFSLTWTRHGRLAGADLWMLDAVSSVASQEVRASRSERDKVPAAWLSEPTLRRRLAEILPFHMIPARIHVADHLPKTPSGKLDRRMLATMVPEAPVVPASSDPLERLIGQIWSGVLKRDDVGPNDNFFDRGGHSLLVLDVLDRLAAAGHQQVSVADFYLFPTIATLADFLRHGRQRYEGHGRATSRGERRRQRARERAGKPHV